MSWKYLEGRSRICKKKYCLASLIIISLAAVLYANTLWNSFVYDDEAVVVGNKFIRSWRNFPSLFSRDYFRLSQEGTYRPVVTSSYFLDYSLWRLNPSGYHLSNLIFHASCGMLLFYLLNLLGVRRAISLLAGPFFIAHPVATEAVNSVSYREDILAFFFFLLAIIFYVKGAKGGRGGGKYYFSSIGSFLLALFSKEMAATLPLIIILTDSCFRIESRPERRLLKFAGFFLALGLYLVVRFLVFANPEIVPPARIIFSRRMMAMSRILVYYFKLFILPLGLSAEYRFRIPHSFGEPGVWLSTVVVLSAAAVSLLFFRRSKLIFFGSWWLFVTLLPVMNIIPLHNMAAERYLYLPAAGFSIVLAEVGGSLLLKKRGFRRVLTWLCCLLLLAFWSAITVRRNRTWRDSLTFFQENLKRCPKSSRFHYNLGNIHQRELRYEEAMAEYREALRVKPEYSRPHNNLGYIYLQREQYKQARAEYEQALEIEPDYADARSNLAVVCFLTGEYGKAKAEWERVLAQNPDYQPARLGLEKLKAAGVSLDPGE